MAGTTRPYLQSGLDDQADLLRRPYLYKDAVFPLLKSSHLDNVLAKFTKWTPWSERLDLSLALPGVYLLAEFIDPIPAATPALESRLIYIGETCGQSLRSRLHQFNRSGFFGKVGHSGGVTFSRTYNPAPDPAWLYLSVMAVDLKEPHASAFIRYLERTLLWAYVQHHGEYPACNQK